MSIIGQAMDQFDAYIDSMADETTTSWPLMTSASRMTVISLIYIFVVTLIGPKLMENRKPYNLKRIILVYNTFQVIACTTLFTWVFQTKPTFGCVPLNSVDASTHANRTTISTHSTLVNSSRKRQTGTGEDDEDEVGTTVQFPTSKKIQDALTILRQAARICWWTTLLKLAEYTETVFFVLRKKQNQVSALHVYHHTSTLVITWGSTKLFPSPMVLLPIMINSLVHMLMYTYYLLSALGPSVQNKITMWKKYITIIQMVQFCILVTYSMQILLPYCEVPNGYAYIFIPNIFLVFYLFFDFYQQAYTKRMQKKTI